MSGEGRGPDEREGAQTSLLACDLRSGAILEANGSQSVAFVVLLMTCNSRSDMLTSLSYQRGLPMSKTVAQLTKEIQRLQKQVDAVKATEVAGVVARIKEAIEHYGLTPEQLFGGRRPGRKKTVALASLSSVSPTPRAKKESRSSVAGAKLPAKYSDGAGNSWTGRGSTPRWLAAALASGKTKEDFAIKSRISS